MSWNQSQHCLCVGFNWTGNNKKKLWEHLWFGNCTAALLERVTVYHNTCTSISVEITAYEQSSYKNHSLKGDNHFWICESLCMPLTFVLKNQHGRFVHKYTNVPYVYIVYDTCIVLTASYTATTVVFKLHQRCPYWATRPIWPPWNNTAGVILTPQIIPGN